MSSKSGAAGTGRSVGSSLRRAGATTSGRTFEPSAVDTWIVIGSVRSNHAVAQHAGERPADGLNTRYVVCPRALRPYMACAGQPVFIALPTIGKHSGEVAWPRSTSGSTGRPHCAASATAESHASGFDGTGRSLRVPGPREECPPCDHLSADRLETDVAGYCPSREYRLIADCRQGGASQFTGTKP